MPSAALATTTAPCVVPRRARPAPVVGGGPLFSLGGTLARVHSAGCRCRHCFSLREYMLALTGKDYGLEAAPGHAPAGGTQCTGELTCPCPDCARSRAARVDEAPRRREIRQPWEPTPPQRPTTR